MVEKSEKLKQDLPVDICGCGLVIDYSDTLSAYMRILAAENRNSVIIKQFIRA